MILSPQSPIAIFDSGVGGLTVMRALRKKLPQESIIYLGDTARLPYGTKSASTIERYAVQAGLTLAKFHPKMIIIACNTASAYGLRALQASLPALPVVGVIEPSAAVAAGFGKPIGVLATRSTIESECYPRAIQHHAPGIEVFSVAAPLLVPFAEEGLIDDPLVAMMAERYLDLFPGHLEHIVLGCTHYPLLISTLKKLRPAINFIESGPPVAEVVAQKLRELGLEQTLTEAPSTRLLFTDTGTRLKELGSHFLGEKISTMEMVNL